VFCAYDGVYKLLQSHLPERIIYKKSQQLIQIYQCVIQDFKTKAQEQKFMLWDCLTSGEQEFGLSKLQNQRLLHFGSLCKNPSSVQV